MARKKTKQEFLEELYEKCDNYKNGDFVVIGNYVNSCTPIILKNKYGYLKTRPADLLRRSSKLSTSSAIFKDAYFREMLRDKSSNFRKGKYKLVTEFNGVENKIVVENRYGLLNATPKELLNDKNPSIRSAVDIDNYVHNMLLIHNTHYRSGRYKIIEGFKGVHKPIVLGDKYGKYKMTLNNLILDYNIGLTSAINLGENVKNRLIEIRGDEYDYSLIKNIKSISNEKLKIVCKVHGVFEQMYGHHRDGSGCPKCGKISAVEYLKLNPTGWTHSDWVEASKKSKNFDSYKTYVLKFEDEINKETFYKVGRTFLTIHKRFSKINKYYNITPVFIFKSDDPVEVINKELELLRSNKNYSYLPFRNFNGKNECFSKVCF